MDECVRGGEKGWDEEEVKGEDQVCVTGKRRELIWSCLGVDEDEEQLRFVTLDSFVPVGAVRCRSHGLLQGTSFIMSIAAFSAWMDFLQVAFRQCWMWRLRALTQLQRGTSCSPVSQMKTEWSVCMSESCRPVQFRRRLCHALRRSS